jgi:flagellar protein FliL
MATPDSKNSTAAEARQKIESKPVVENKAGATAKGKSGKMWILVGVLVLAVAGGAAYFAVPYFKAGRQASAGSKQNPGSKESEPAGARHEKVKSTLDLEPFLVNLADTDEIRFVKTTFKLGLAEELGEEDKNPVVIAAMRDSIISLLSSKTAEQILTPEGKDKLREEIRSRAGAISPKIKVLEVYIVDFVVQL